MRATGLPIRSAMADGNELPFWQIGSQRCFTLSSNTDASQYCIALEALVNNNDGTVDVTWASERVEDIGAGAIIDGVTYTITVNGTTVDSFFGSISTVRTTFRRTIQASGGDSIGISMRSTEFDGGQTQVSASVTGGGVGGVSPDLLLLGALGLGVVLLRRR